MKRKLFLTSIVLALFSVAVLAETKSDYDRSYDFSKLRTWDFKVLNRMPTDPVGANSLWNQRIRDGLEQHFAEIGYKKINDGEPDFLLGYFMGIKRSMTSVTSTMAFLVAWDAGVAGVGGMAGDLAAVRWTCGEFPTKNQHWLWTLLIPTPISWFGEGTIPRRSILTSRRRRFTNP